MNPIDSSTLFSFGATILVAIVGWFARNHAAQIAALQTQNEAQDKMQQSLEVRLAVAEQRVHETNKHVENFRDEIVTIREHMARKEDLDRLQDAISQRIEDALRLPRRAGKKPD